MEHEQQAEATAVGPESPAARAAAGAALIDPAAMLSLPAGVVSSPAMRAAGAIGIQRSAGNRAMARMAKGSGGRRTLAREPAAPAQDPEATAMVGDIVKLVYEKYWERWRPPKELRGYRDGVLQSLMPDPMRQFFVMIGSVSKTAGVDFEAIKAGDQKALSNLMAGGGEMSDAIYLAAKGFLDSPAGKGLVEEVVNRYKTMPGAAVMALRTAVATNMSALSNMYLADAQWSETVRTIVGLNQEEFATLRTRAQALMAIAWTGHIAQDLGTLVKTATNERSIVLSGSASIPGGRVAGQVVYDGDGVTLKGLANVGDLKASGSAQGGGSSPGQLEIKINDKDATHHFQLRENGDLHLSSEAFQKISGSTSVGVKTGAPGSAELKLVSDPSRFFKFKLNGLLTEQKLTTVSGSAEYKKDGIDASVLFNASLTPDEQSKVAAHFGFESKDKMLTAWADVAGQWGGAGIDQGTLNAGLKYASKQLAFEAKMDLTLRESALSGTASAKFGYTNGLWSLHGVGGLNIGPNPTGYAGAEVGVPAPLLDNQSLVFGVRTPPPLEIGPGGGSNIGTIQAPGAVFTLTLRAGKKPGAK